MAHPFESQVRAAGISFALAALGTASAVHAQPTPRVIYVDAAAPSGGNGQLWTSAIRDLQDALTLANTDPMRAARPVEIHIAQGIYLPNRGAGNPLPPFVVASAVSLLGGFAGLTGAQPDTQDPSRFVSVFSGDLLQNDGPNFANRADNASTIVRLTGNDNRVDGLTISGGGCNALVMTISGATISRCRVTDNQCLNPSIYGSVCILTSSVISDCEFSDNATRNATVVELSQCTALRTTFAGNHVTHDPSIYADRAGTLSLTYPCSLVACLFAANTSDSAGAVFTGGDNVALYNCTFADNTSVSGPALYVQGTAQVWNCVFARNAAATGVPSHQIYVGTGPQLSMHASFLQGGTSDVLTQSGYTFYSPGAFITGNPGFVNPSGPDGNPLTWRDNDYRLLPQSPCIDRGSTFPLLYMLDYRDLLGHIPVDAPAVPNTGSGFATYLDLGAYEFIPNPCRADFNNSGSLSPQDIFDFLTAWFALSPAADFNGSGTITAQDIFDFLGAWFSGC